MRLLILIIVLNVSAADLNRISRINKLKKEAEVAFKSEDFAGAIAALSVLADSIQVNEDPVWLNLANAYYMANDTANARVYYSKVLGAEDRVLKSQAHQQLGVIQQKQNKLPEALAQFKSALKSNPSNEDARYNYELLKKLMDSQQEQEQDNNKDIEPSEYARKLKEQADRLARQNLFNQALNIMQMGLQEDETVAAYNDYISKLKDVVESKE